MSACDCVFCDTVRCDVAVRERRMNVKAAFQNYDKTNRGIVTKNQFTCVLGFLGLLPPLKADQDVLLKAFGMLTPGKTDQCHYPSFCNLVDPPAVVA